MKVLILICPLLHFTAIAEELEASYKNESELGIVVTSGNSDVFTLSAKQSSIWLGPKESYLLKARYLRSSNEGFENALQWGIGLRYERSITDPLGFFLGESLESNIYQLILQRYSTDIGGKYFFHKEKKLNWFAEAGYRFMRENYPIQFQNSNLARLYSEVELEMSLVAIFKLSLEYLPNFSRWSGYLLNSGFSLTSAFSDSFSLKSGFDFRYNHEPPAGARSDVDRIFTTALVAKF
jgi:putative salt-induced outer membrane protein YdiY